MKKLSFETKIVLTSLASSLPFLILLVVVMLKTTISIWLTALTGLIGFFIIFYASTSIYKNILYQFRSLNNLIDSLNRGDYSIRAKKVDSYDELTKLLSTINGLGHRLSIQRRATSESQILVDTILEHIDVAIIALNHNNEVSFRNPAAKHLLMCESDSLENEVLEQLIKIETSGKFNQVAELELGHFKGRFNIHIETFRESGFQNKLFFITDVQDLLRKEERNAWQKLVRVISHEINNSLSPIGSISQTLLRLMSKPERIDDSLDDILEGLSTIRDRADGLKTFIKSYNRITKTPEPNLAPTSILRLCTRACALLDKERIRLETQEDAILNLDSIQFEQVLINLIKNAIESTNQVDSKDDIIIKWQITRSRFKLFIIDSGAGITNPNNLFVPFFSTKKTGSGIGLVLSQQIIEAHNGRLSLKNNEHNEGGCTVTIDLPYEDLTAA